MPISPSTHHTVLLVDDDAAVRDMMAMTLEHKGFNVVSAANVTEALKHIATESFDVLLTDLHMPNPGDGFTVVTAMRHSQPDALTLLVSGYPDVQSAMAAILLEADEVIVKPFDVAGERESGCDTSALYNRCYQGLAGARKTEQRTQSCSTQRRGTHWTPPKVG